VLLDLAGPSRAIQCNLPINLFNELIFLILWGWLIFLTGLTSVSLLFYIISTVAKLDRKFVRTYLNMNTTLVAKEADRERFVDDYLRCNGILVLRILAQNTNDIIMAKLVGALFRLYAQSWAELDDGSEVDYQTGQTFI
jgi:innexin